MNACSYNFFSFLVIRQEVLGVDGEHLWLKNCEILLLLKLFL